MNTLKIDDVEFIGPFDTLRDIEDRAGVYVVVREFEQDYEVVDFGFAEHLQQDLVDSDDPDQINSYLAERIMVGVHYVDMSESTRSVDLLNWLENWFENSDVPIAVRN